MKAQKSPQLKHLSNFIWSCSEMKMLCNSSDISFCPAKSNVCTYFANEILFCHGPQSVFKQNCDGDKLMRTKSYKTFPKIFVPQGGDGANKWLTFFIFPKTGNEVKGHVNNGESNSASKLHSIIISYFITLLHSKLRTLYKISIWIHLLFFNILYQQ